MALISSWKTPETDEPLLRLGILFLMGSQKSPLQLSMPGYLSHSTVILGLRGKDEISISQGDYLSGPGGFWKGCNDSSKACTDSWFGVISQAGCVSLESSQMFLQANVRLFVSGPQVSCLLPPMTHSHGSHWKAYLQTVMVILCVSVAWP